MSLLSPATLPVPVPVTLPLALPLSLLRTIPLFPELTPVTAPLPLIPPCPIPSVPLLSPRTALPPAVIATVLPTPARALAGFLNPDGARVCDEWARVLPLGHIELLDGALLLVV